MRHQHAAATAGRRVRARQGVRYRRGRGESGDTAPYAIEREFEDIAALIGDAGGRPRDCPSPKVGAFEVLYDVYPGAAQEGHVAGPKAVAPILQRFFGV